MATHSLLSCFDEPLPGAMIFDPGDYSRGDSSVTVANQKPPKYLIQEPVSVYIDKTKNFLNDNGPILAGMQEPQPEPNRVLRTEADVVAHARSSLLTPIEQAIQVVDRYTGKVYVHAESPMKNKLRVDIAIMHNQVAVVHGSAIPEGFTDTEQPVVLVEFKRAGLIDEEVFSDLMWEPKELNSLLRPHVPDADKNTSKAGLTTSQLKQVTAYAARKECNYGALCDYSSLILFRFDNNRTVAYVTIVEETDFRKALLGFFLHACSTGGI
ncbi:hypothetical protein C7974DRAFT_377535 [Boeremia exigua]|uniref:uncharacterized protein n=1 Tax=Boeremia exigua TaxID=749465 RepID=UPI001E8DA40B|nr:uncharacterized protein C7974DRAFT_377535 [Boeremia exigua]KAH6621882.1 hypothetical protein C7974DRAFT_377535 [Boeremia exigua]